MSTKYDRSGPHERNHGLSNHDQNVPEVKYEGLDYRIPETNKEKSEDVL
jgi:hypothetical protein